MTAWVKVRNCLFPIARIGNLTVSSSEEPVKKLELSRITRIPGRWRPFFFIHRFLPAVMLIWSVLPFRPASQSLTCNSWTRISIFLTWKPSAATHAVTSEWLFLFLLGGSKLMCCDYSASWRKAGYPSVFTIGTYYSPGCNFLNRFVSWTRFYISRTESTFDNSNKYIHSAKEWVLIYSCHSIHLFWLGLWFHLVLSTSVKSSALITCLNSPSLPLRSRLSWAVGSNQTVCHLAGLELRNGSYPHVFFFLGYSPMATNDIWSQWA